MDTTIQVSKNLVNSLKQMKEHPRQTYEELIKNMMDVFSKVRRENQYDEFLHKIQMEKMKELWDNESDKIWENL